MQVTLNKDTNNLELMAETSKDLRELTKMRDYILKEVLHPLISYESDDKGQTSWLHIPVNKR